jgi:hypothetical protein
MFTKITPQKVRHSAGYMVESFDRETMIYTDGDLTASVYVEGCPDSIAVDRNSVKKNPVEELTESEKERIVQRVVKALEFMDERPVEVYSSGNPVLYANTFHKSITNTSELLRLIEEYLDSYSERMSGNEINSAISNWLRRFLDSDREALVGAMREYLSFRKRTDQQETQNTVFETRLWMALHIIVTLRLDELSGDIEKLLTEIRAGKILQINYVPFILRYLNELQISNS